MTILLVEWGYAVGVSLLELHSIAYSIGTAYLTIPQLIVVQCVFDLLAFKLSLPNKLEIRHAF